MNSKFQTFAISVLVVVLTVAVYYVGVGAGANQKEAEMKAEANDGLEKALSNRISALEAKDIQHESAMSGAATRLAQQKGMHENWVRVSTQSQSVTRAMIGLMERTVSKDVGKSKWKKLVDESKADVEKETKERAKVRAEVEKKMKAEVP